MVEKSLLLAGNLTVTAFDPCSMEWSDSFSYDCVETSPSENCTRLSRRSINGDSESMRRAPRRFSGAFGLFGILLVVGFSDLL